MKTYNAKKLPKILAGAVISQRVRCGKANCKCARGQLHGVYWYRFWREHGRLRKQYVRCADVDRVRIAIEAHRQERRKFRADYLKFRELLQSLREIEGNDYNSS